MKKWEIILFLGIILLVSLSSVSAIQGVCTGTQTCFCSGKSVSCPCNADPCVICGPTSPECTGQTGKVQTETGTTDIRVVNTANPQTFGDYMAVLGNGFNNLFRSAMGKPIIVGGKVEITPPSTAERIVSLAALAALLAALIAIIKSIIAKSLMARKGMSRARPSYLQSKMRKRGKPGHGCFPIPKKK
jgi:hypothetical protein